MTELTELERAVLDKLLSGEHPVLNALRPQLEECRASSRKMTGCGFFTHLDVGDTRAAGDVKLIFGDVSAEIEGMAHGAGFVLFVEHGRLSMLEGYSYDDPWPDTITSYALEYDTGDKRDWTALRKVLGESGSLGA
jgi:hypothetical protein